MQTVVCERCQRMRKKPGWVRWVVVRWYSKLLYARHSVWGHEAVSLGRASVARLHPACCHCSVLLQYSSTPFSFLMVTALPRDQYASHTDAVVSMGPRRQ